MFLYQLISFYTPTITMNDIIAFVIVFCFCVLSLYVIPKLKKDIKRLKQNLSILYEENELLKIQNQKRA